MQLKPGRQTLFDEGAAEGDQAFVDPGLKLFEFAEYPLMFAAVLRLGWKSRLLHQLFFAFEVLFAVLVQGPEQGREFSIAGRVQLIQQVDEFVMVLIDGRVADADYWY
jgi:hypothetical protein